MHSRGNISQGWKIALYLLEKEFSKPALVFLLTFRLACLLTNVVLVAKGHASGPQIEMIYLGCVTSAFLTSLIFSMGMAVQTLAWYGGGLAWTSTQPTRLGALQFGWIFYAVLRGMFEALFTALFILALVQPRVTIEGIALMLLVMLLGLPAFIGIGMILQSMPMITKSYGHFIITAVAYAFVTFGGTFFSPRNFPSYFGWVSYLAPQTYAMGAIRVHLGLDHGRSIPELLGILLAIGVVTVPLGYWLHRKTWRWGAATGVFR